MSGLDFDENLKTAKPLGGGLKYDAGKAPLSLIPYSAQYQEALVLAFGAKKYDSWNWSKGMQWSRLIDAALRHIGAYADGQDLDPESQLNHLAHARCCLGFLLDMVESFPEGDDRRPRLKPTA